MSPYFTPMKLPKHYRQQIYVYIEELLGRPLTFEEHDDLRDMMLAYVFSTRNLGNMVRRTFCIHTWVSDQQIQGGEHARAFMKCRKCDKRALKRVPTPSV